MGKITEASHTLLNEEYKVNEIRNKKGKPYSLPFLFI
jgi:hypothetical protein